MADRNSVRRGIDQVGLQFVEKTGKIYEKAQTKAGRSAEQHKPAGGFDDTPIPPASHGYTLKFTFHRATNLPFADLSTFSSDPYLTATITTDLPKRNKEDSDLFFRTPTIRKCTDPEWNAEWIVANIPASGFRMKVRLYDEDPADRDDRLGNAYVVAANIDDFWTGIREQTFKVHKRSGSKRAYMIRGLAACVSPKVDLDGALTVSVESLGITDGPEEARIWTVGPNYWTQHFSPLIGRIAGTKEDDDHTVNAQTNNGEAVKKKRAVQKYNFQANQIQLSGPVPAALYHRYVEFKPFVAGMFTSHSLRGRILNHALHHQHARIYNYNRTTIYGVYEHPSPELTLQFLRLVHFDKGGRIFTYVVTLDAQLRFTETGKEFSIDLLSKHTMHSDVSIYVAWAGEFFIRRLHHRHEDSHPTLEVDGAPVKEEPPQNPACYELVIDNDSGTYRPNGALLPQLRHFLEYNFPGLRIKTLDCQKDAEEMEDVKRQQRERKKKEGLGIHFMQGSSSDDDSSSSISSSDEEELERLERGNDGEGAYEKFKRGIKGDVAKEKYKNWVAGSYNYRDGIAGAADGEASVSTSTPQV